MTTPPVPGSLEALRKKIADALSATTPKLNAHAVIPGTATPPLVYVAPDDPYVTWEEGTSFGECLVHHQVVVVTKAGTGEKRVPELEADVLTAVKALNTIDNTDVTAVSGFFAVTLTGSGQQMACAIETRTYFPLDV